MRGKSQSLYGLENLSTGGRQEPNAISCVHLKCRMLTVMMHDSVMTHGPSAASAHLCILLPDSPLSHMHHPCSHHPASHMFWPASQHSASPIDASTQTHAHRLNTQCHTHNSKPHAWCTKVFLLSPCACAPSMPWTSMPMLLSSPALWPPQHIGPLSCTPLAMLSSHLASLP